MVYLILLLFYADCDRYCGNGNLHLKINRNSCVLIDSLNRFGVSFVRFNFAVRETKELHEIFTIKVN